MGYNIDVKYTYHRYMTTCSESLTPQRGSLSVHAAAIWPEGTARALGWFWLQEQRVDQSRYSLRKPSFGAPTVAPRIGPRFRWRICAWRQWARRGHVRAAASEGGSRRGRHVLPTHSGRGKTQFQIVPSKSASSIRLANDPSRRSKVAASRECA